MSFIHNNLPCPQNSTTAHSGHANEVNMWGILHKLNPRSNKTIYDQIIAGHVTFKS